MKIIYVGNFGPPHSTENHVARALERNGHEVVRMQESDRDAWFDLAYLPWLKAQEASFLLWTRTRFDHYDDPDWVNQRLRMLLMCDRIGLPTIGYHLDRWWGLHRETEPQHEPFFRVNTLVTADGGHDDEWARIGVDHYWMPPAVSEVECEPGMFRPEFASDIAFTGNWDGSYHHEWGHRMELVNWLASTYGDRVQFWPKRGEHALRGGDLRDLYASVKVLVGDSCLVPRRDGKPITRYCSDRIPETLGRGGLLIHPDVVGVTLPDYSGVEDGKKLIADPPPWVGGDHLFTWNLGDWEMLRNTINLALADPEGRSAQVRAAGREHTLKLHTYERRMETLVRLVTEWYGVKA